MRAHANRHAWTIGVCLLGTSWLGCAGLRPAPQTGPATLATTSAPADTVDEPQPAPFDVEALMDEAEASMTLGREAYTGGDLDAARTHFDQAIELFLDAPVAVESDARLAESFASLVDEIYTFEVESWRQPSVEDQSEAELVQTVEATAELAALETTVAPPVEPPPVAVPTREQFELPVVFNSKVQSYLNLFQGSGRERFARIFRRSGKYLPMAQRIFEEAGLPRDLAYMAQIESAWKPRALSRVRAKGLWQFMSFTGRKYGLGIDYWVDERSDPEKATRAAAAYLKDLYAMFGDWNLAMAAYNAGEGKIQRAIKRAHTDDFWKIARTRYIMRETKEFVPQILATVIIARSPERYGFTRDKEPELFWSEVEIEGFADIQTLARCADTTPETIRELNPELRRGVTPPDRDSYRLKVPVGSASTFVAAYEQLPKQDRLAWAQHRVSRGDTLGQIANRYGSSVSVLMAANGIRDPRQLQIGQVLQVPSGGVNAAALDRLGGAAASGGGGGAYSYGQQIGYRVRRGDSLSSIARRFRTSVQNLASWNGIEGTLIHPGQRLTVYYGVQNTQIAAGSVASSPSGATTAEAHHTVRSGDTLFSIARRYGTSVSRLCSWNGISQWQTLYPGDRLKVR